jgi:hypothetical protein
VGHGNHGTRKQIPCTETATETLGNHGKNRNSPKTPTKGRDQRANSPLAWGARGFGQECALGATPGIGATETHGNTPNLKRGRRSHAGPGNPAPFEATLFEATQKTCAFAFLNRFPKTNPTTETHENPQRSHGILHGGPRKRHTEAHGNTHGNPNTERADANPLHPWTPGAKCANDPPTTPSTECICTLYGDKVDKVSTANRAKK